MKKLSTILVLLLVIVGGLYALGYDQSDGQWVEDMNISLVSNPSPPKVGQNTLQVNIRDRSGLPLTDAQVAFYYFDVSPAYQIPQEYPVVETKGTLTEDRVYTTEVHLKKPGSWKVAVKVHHAEERHPPNRPVSTAWFTLTVE